MLHHDRNNAIELVKISNIPRGARFLAADEKRAPSLVNGHRKWMIGPNGTLNCFPKRTGRKRAEMRVFFLSLCAYYYLH